MASYRVKSTREPRLNSVPALYPNFTDYLWRHQRFYARYRERWPGTLCDPYDLLDPQQVKYHDFAKLVSAAHNVLSLYRRINQFLKSAPYQLYEELGIPAEVIYLSQCDSPVSDFLLTRLDFVRSDEGWKFLECNFDNPGLMVETFAINEVVCSEIGRCDPNRAASRALPNRLHRAIASAARHLGKRVDECRVGVCSPSNYKRDTDAARYVVDTLRSVRQVNAYHVWLEELRADEVGVYDWEDRKIDVLFRGYPLREFCRLGIPYKNRPNITLDYRQLHTLCTQRKLAIVNTAFAAVLESKAVQALIWLLCDEEMYFGPEDRQLVRRYMPRTFFDRPRHLEKFVVKPMYGCEGSGIRVIDSTGNVMERTIAKHDSRELCVYQQYIEIPSIATMTEFGIQELRFVMSVFMVNDSELGICYRAGEGITDASWWVAPVYLADCKNDLRRPIRKTL